MVEIKDYFEKIKEEKKVLRFWFTWMDEDECCIFKFVNQVVVNDGKLIGLLLNDEDTDNGYEFYPIHEIERWQYWDKDQKEYIPGTDFMCESNIQ